MVLQNVTERDRFEPSVPVIQYAKCLRPIGHLSAREIRHWRRFWPCDTPTLPSDFPRHKDGDRLRAEYGDYGTSIFIRGTNCWPPWRSPSAKSPCERGRGMLNLNARALSHSKNCTTFSAQWKSSANFLGERTAARLTR